MDGAVLGSKVEGLVLKWTELLDIFKYIYNLLMCLPTFFPLPWVLMLVMVRTSHLDGKSSSNS